MRSPLIPWLIAWLLIPLTAGALQPSLKDRIEFDRFEESSGTFYFQPQTAPPFKSSFSDLKYLGTLKAPRGLPYFLVLARPCRGACLDEPTLFAVRPYHKNPSGFVPPGKILDPKTRTVLLDSRAFFGKCLPNRSDLYIAFQQERVDRRARMQSSVFIAEAAEEHLNESLQDRHAPSLSTVLKQVKLKQCKEVSGRNRYMLTRPLDLHPHSPNTDDDEDSDNPPPVNSEEEGKPGEPESPSN
jgi:hypothetical protein